MKRLLLLLLLVGLLCNPGRAEDASPVEISAHVDRSRVGLGETLVLTVDVAWPLGVDVQLPPAEKLDLAPFEVRDATLTPQPTSEGRKRSRYVARLAAFEQGQLGIPSLRVSYRTPDGTAREAASAPIPVEVGTASPAPGPGPSGEPAGIRDLKPIAEVSTPAWMIAAAGAAGIAGVGLLAALGLLVARRLRRRPTAVVPPHEQARAALRALLAERLPEKGHLKEHYDRLAGILREYLARRFDLPCLEHTTVEVVAMMRDRPLDETLCVEVRHVLDEADLVKFARLQVPLEKARAQVECVQGIVERTVPPPPAPAGSQPPPPPPVPAKRAATSREG